MKKLSHELIDFGFFSVLGTLEHSAPRKAGDFVGHRTSNTHDRNNGVKVVYDEEGRPWIISSDYDQEFTEKLQKVLEEYEVKQGAYVPHSNDDGYFIHEILPKL